MKITTYQVIINIGGDLSVEAFANTQDATQCAWGHIKNIFQEDGGADGYEANDFEGWRDSLEDIYVCWESLCHGIHDTLHQDTLHIEKVEIDVPQLDKITVYTMAADTRDGFKLETYATQSAQEAAAREWLAELWADGGFDESEKPDFDTCDIFETWDYVRADDVDSLWLEESEIEIPAPVPAETARAVIEVRGGIAHITHCPPGVEVEIIDHDNLEDERHLPEIAEEDE